MSEKLEKRLVVEFENERARSQKIREICSKADLKCLTTASKRTLEDVLLHIGDTQIETLYDELVKHRCEV